MKLFYSEMIPLQMGTFSKSKQAMYWIGGFLIVFFVVPNTTNFKERKAFSDEVRIAEAIALYPEGSTSDSVVVAAGKHYRRGKFFTLFMGEKHRELWATPVQVRVFHVSSEKGGMTPYEVGGNQQTTSLRLKDKQERKWALRSVNKDQKYVLPGILRITGLRFLVRDQVTSCDPYGHLVLPELAEAIGIYHNTPELVFIPYDSLLGEYAKVMGGRLAYLEQHLNSSWKGEERYGSPLDIVNTEDMMAAQQKNVVPVDTTLYLRSRLFDMLISDWDRHEGQWEWALVEKNETKVYAPIPKDRDNAFYLFNQGILSRAMLLFENKFQSYHNEYASVRGLMKQSKSLDTRILAGVPQEKFVKEASLIRQRITPSVIRKAFSNYPAPIYKKTGNKHERVLERRLEKLEEVSLEFYRHVNK